MSGRPIRVGHIDLSFHDASAREVEAILVEEGHAVERFAAPHEEMFARLGRGEVDVLVSAWLPASHGAYLVPFEADVRKLGILYEPYCFWACHITCRTRYRASPTSSAPWHSGGWSDSSRGSTAMGSIRAEAPTGKTAEVSS